MTEMFGLLKELTTRRTPEKVLIREEAKFLITKNVNSFSLTNGEEERSDKISVATGNDIEKTTETETGMQVKETEKKNEAEKEEIIEDGEIEREMSLLEFGWRVGLYSEMESRDVATLSGLRREETVNSTHVTHSFWPSIGDGMFNVGNTKAQSIRNPGIKLEEEDDGDDEEGDRERGNEGFGGFTDFYRNMSEGD
nr:hypothetical protein [Tanacetum cinerariifolium]